MDYSSFVIEDYKFIQDSDWYVKINLTLLKLYYSVLGIDYPSPAVTFKDHRRLYSIPNLLDLGNIIGFNEQLSQEIFSYHKKSCR